MAAGRSSRLITDSPAAAAPFIASVLPMNLHGRRPDDAIHPARPAGGFNRAAGLITVIASSVPGRRAEAARCGATVLDAFRCARKWWFIVGRLRPRRLAIALAPANLYPCWPRPVCTILERVMAKPLDPKMLLTPGIYIGRQKTAAQLTTGLTSTASGLRSSSVSPATLASPISLASTRPMVPRPPRVGPHSNCASCSTETRFVK
jgi:hypothetical protein